MNDHPWNFRWAWYWDISPTWHMYVWVGVWDLACNSLFFLWSVFLTPNCILFFQSTNNFGGMLELVIPYCEWWRQGVHGQSCQPVAGVAFEVGLMCCQSQVWDISPPQDTNFSGSILCALICSISSLPSDQHSCYCSGHPSSMLQVFAILTSRCQLTLTR